MADYEFNTTPEDSKGRGHKAVDPTKYTDMAQYLEAIMAEARETNDNSILGDYLLNIMAARDHMEVKPNNLDGLQAMHLSDSDKEKKEEIAKGIQKAHMDLVENEVMQEFLSSRSVDYLKDLVSSGGHGGKLERDVKKFVLAYKGPIPKETPERYTPTALTRIEVLQKQLKGLMRNDPEFKERATSICMEIAATRAAVDCKRGDKATLKHKYDLDKMNRHYNALMKTAGKDLSDENLNRLMRGALKTPGHGGTMEKVVQDLVREDMQRNHRTPDGEVPARYQVTYGERFEVLREDISGCLDVIKMGRKLEPQKKQQLKEALAEVTWLKGSADVQSERNNGAPADGLRVDQSAERVDLTIQKMATHKGLNQLLDRLEQGEDVVDELDAALKDGMNSQKVREIVHEEINKAKLEELAPYARQQLLNERRKKQQDQIATDDLKVEGKTGSKLRKEMSDQLTIEALDIKLHEPNLDNPDKINPDSIRKLRVICDKRMAIMRAFQKSQDPNTKQVDEQKFARELNGERFKQNIREVRQDPVYQRTMKDMTAQAQNTKEGVGPTLCEAAWYPAGSLEPLIVKTAKKMQMEVQNPEAQKNMTKQQNSPEKQQVLG